MRYTTRDVDSQIELVKTAAERAGVTTLTFNGGTVATLRRESAYGTHKITCETRDGGSIDLSDGRGTRECILYLQGLYAALDAVARHNPEAFPTNPRETTWERIGRELSNG